MLSIILVLIVYLFLSFIIYYNERIVNKNYVFSIISFLFLFIFSGFRHYEILNDSLAYKEIFDNTLTYNFTDIFTGRIEPFYQLINKLIKSFISNDYSVLFIITSIIIQLSILKFIFKNSSKVWFSVYLFFSFRFYLFSLSAIRQGIALGLTLLAFNYLKKNEKKYFILIVLIASLFHYSALIFYLVLIFRNSKFEKNKVIIMSILTLIIFSLIGPILSVYSEYSTYGSDYLDVGTKDNFSDSFGAILIFLMTLTSLLFSLYFKKKYLRVYDLELWLLFFGTMISFVTIKFPILMRFTYYFSIFSIILIPNVISYLKYSSQRRYLRHAWIIVTTAYILTILYLRPEWYNFYPYKFFWNE
jgi:hypothetical protein